MKILPWLKFFRIVNLPTVPGDVLVGASVAGVSCSLSAVVSSCALYLYGLADNDIVGAKTDDAFRPIPAGEISLRAARLARALCLLCAIGAGLMGNLPFVWWLFSSALLVLEVLYNRTKKAYLMGLCRGVNVLCGTMGLFSWVVALVALVWMVYIGAVTKYSEGEEKDPTKKACVGFLIGALVYLQLLVLVLSYLFAPTDVTRGTLLSGAAMLLALRFFKRVLPKVSAS